jgi:hypothetical protein
VSTEAIGYNVLNMSSWLTVFKSPPAFLVFWGLVSLSVTERDVFKALHMDLFIPLVLSCFASYIFSLLCVCVLRQHIAIQPRLALNLQCSS